MAVYSDLLKELRRDKGLCQADVGAYFGISGPMYCLYENGDRRMRLEMLCALADLFGTSTDYLLGRTRNSKPYCASTPSIAISPR